MEHYHDHGFPCVWDGGYALTLLPPFPEDPRDPVDPLDCSKIGDFIETVVIFGLDGAPA